MEVLLLACKKTCYLMLKYLWEEGEKTDLPALESFFL